VKTISSFPMVCLQSYIGGTKI